MKKGKFVLIPAPDQTHDRGTHTWQLCRNTGGSCCKSQTLNESVTKWAVMSHLESATCWVIHEASIMKYSGACGSSLRVVSSSTCIVSFPGNIIS